MRSWTWWKRSSARSRICLSLIELSLTRCILRKCGRRWSRSTVLRKNRFLFISWFGRTWSFTSTSGSSRLWKPRVKARAKSSKRPLLNDEILKTSQLYTTYIWNILLERAHSAIPFWPFNHLQRNKVFLINFNRVFYGCRLIFSIFHLNI